MQTPEEHLGPLFAAYINQGALAAADLIRARDAEVREAARAEALAGFHVVYTLAWDGEPSMSGEPHRNSAGAR